LYFAVEDFDGRPLTAPARGDSAIFVVIRANVRRLDPSLKIGFTLFNQDSHEILTSLTTDTPEQCWPTLSKGEIELRCELPRRLLNEGLYRLELVCSLHFRERLVKPGRNSPMLYFRIQGGLSDSPYWISSRRGLLAPVWKWERTR